MNDLLKMSTFEKLFESSSVQSNEHESKYNNLLKVFSKAVNKTDNCIGEDFLTEECEDERQQIIITMVLTYAIVIICLIFYKLTNYYFNFNFLCSKKVFLI